MLSFRNVFRKDHEFGSVPVGTTIRIIAGDEPPECRMKAKQSARRALALITSITGYDLDDFIEMRFERFRDLYGDDVGARKFHAEYDPPHTWNQRPQMEALIYDEMCDWLNDKKPRDKEEAAKALSMLAACHWKVRNIDAALNAANKALTAYRMANRGYGDLFRMCQGIKGIGYMYWGLDAIDHLNEAALLEDKLDTMLQQQFSTCIMDGLAVCHKRAGQSEKAASFVRWADQLRLSSPHPGSFMPSWGVRTPPWLAENGEGQ